jgi:hypothetical protein
MQKLLCSADITNEGAAGLSLSDQLSVLLCQPWDTSVDIGDVKQYATDFALVGYDSVRKCIMYINVFGSYSGKLPDGLGLRDSIIKAERLGWAFRTERDILDGPGWTNPRYPNILISNERGDFAEAAGEGVVSCISIGSPLD